MFDLPDDDPVDDPIDTPNDGPLTRLFANVPDDVLPAKLAEWGMAIEDDDLRHDILNNPRLKGRIVKAIMDDAPEVYPEDVIDTPDEAVIAMLMGGQKQQLLNAIGIAVHQPTILDWVTWNTIADKMPDTPLSLVRAVVSANLPTGTGDDDAVNPKLTPTDLSDDGETVLAVWAGALEQNILTRLRYFVELDDYPGSLDVATYAQDVAFAIVGHDKGSNDE